MVAFRYEIPLLGSTKYLTQSLCSLVRYRVEHSKEKFHIYAHQELTSVSVSLLVAQTICDTDKPCLNGGHCSSNTSSPTHYTCDCGDWFSGTNCEGIFTFYLLSSFFF